jgi:hypothetical protein
MCILTFITLILFLFITYHSIQERLNKFISRIDKKTVVLENMVNSLMSEAGQIMFGMSMMMSQESIESKNQDVYKIISSFGYTYNKHRSIPFSTFRVIDVNNIVIASSEIPDRIFHPIKVKSDLNLLEMAKANAFDLKIGEIRSGRYNKSLLQNSNYAK